MSELAQIRKTALRALSRREYGEWELIQKLTGKGFDAQQAQQVVEDLKEKDLVNDQRFAATYLRVHAKRGQGPVKIARELARCRIDRQVIAGLVDETAEIWNERISAVVHKKYQGRPVRDYKEWASRDRFLRSRGFTTPQIAGALGRFERVRREVRT